MPDTSNRFKRLRVLFDQTNNPSTASLPVISVWNPDAGPDGNIFTGTPDTLPTLFERLGFQVTEFRRVAPDGT